MLVMSLKQRKRNFNQGWIHLQLRPVSTVVLLPRRTQKFDSRTAVARRLKPSRATAVYYAAVAHWNFLLFLGQKTLKKNNATVIRVCCKWIHPTKDKIEPQHTHSFWHTYIVLICILETSVPPHFFTTVWFSIKWNYFFAFRFESTIPAHWYDPAKKAVNKDKLIMIHPVSSVLTLCHFRVGHRTRNNFANIPSSPKFILLNRFKPQGVCRTLYTSLKSFISNAKFILPMKSPCIPYLQNSGQRP